MEGECIERERLPYRLLEPIVHWPDNTHPREDIDRGRDKGEYRRYGDLAIGGRRQDRTSEDRHYLIDILRRGALERRADVIQRRIAEDQEDIDLSAFGIEVPEPCPEVDDGIKSPFSIASVPESDAPLCDVEVHSPSEGD